MLDRFTVYAVIVVAVVSLPAGAWTRMKYSEYLLTERRLNCEQNYYSMLEVFRIHSLSACAEFIDEYRYFETLAGGFLFELAETCRQLAADPRRIRELVCSDPYYPSYVPPVSYFANRGRRDSDLLFYAVGPTL